MRQIQGSLLILNSVFSCKTLLWQIETAKVSKMSNLEGGRESIASERSAGPGMGGEGGSPIIYQVAPEMLTEESSHVSPSQVISFELTKDDINRYVYSR